MGIWKRLVVTVLAMLIASLAVGLIWRVAFDASIPSYLSGVVGGLTALAAWEFLRKK